jgi:glucuronate isomerase
MNREDLLEKILAMPVWDTHTHLTVDALPAKSFWDIGHYFWFLRELQAAGYPRDAEELSEEKRITAYVDAFAATRNTSMNWVVRHIFENLYSIKIKDAESIRAADHAVRQTAQQRDWPQAVVDRLAIRRICVHGRSHREFSDLPGVVCTIPIDANIDRGVLVERVATALDRCAVASEIAQEIDLARRLSNWGPLPTRFARNCRLLMLLAKRSRRLWVMPCFVRLRHTASLPSSFSGYSRRRPACRSP